MTSNPNKSLLDAKCGIFSGAEVFINCRHTRLKKYALDIDSLIRLGVKDKNQATSAPAAECNIIDELQRLAALKNSGILSEEEFTALKSKLIAKHIE